MTSANWTTFNNKSEVISASNTAGVVVATATNFKFDTTSFAVTNPSTGVAAVGVADSGWLDLEGFDFMPAASRPEYRVIGKMVVFRGVAYVPLASNVAGTTLIAMTNSGTGAFYVNQPYAYTYTGSSPSNGCDINVDGSITFNKSNSIFQTAITLDGVYSKGFTICQRVVKTSDAGTGVSLSTVFQVAITAAGLLVIGTYRDAEVSPYIPDSTNAGLGLGTLRQIVSRVNAGQFVPDYTLMTDTPTPSETNSSKSNTAFAQSYSISTATNSFVFDVDSAEPDQIGGFQIRLDGLVAYIA